MSRQHGAVVSIPTKETAMKTALTFSLALTAVAVSGMALANEAAPKKDRTEVNVQKPVKPAGMSDRTKTVAAVAKGYETRDWAKIDKNKDNLISPDEMETYLKENPGPLRPAK
jgi:hypothetical protein